MSKKVLVTGATGFIGKYVAQLLLDNGYSIKCLVRETSDRSFYDGKENVEFFVGELTKPETLEGIEEGVEYAVHLAAMGHVSSVSEEAYNAFVGINEKGTQNLINRLKKNADFKKFVHFSSTAAMGPIGLPVLNEESVPNPVTPYQKSKLRSEQVVLNAFKEGFPALIVRPCMVYGVGGLGEFHKFYKLMKKGRFPKVGKGKNLTPMVYVTDVAKGAFLALEKGKPGEAYIIASDKSFVLDDIRNEIVKYANPSAKYPYVPKNLALMGAKILEKFYSMRGKEPIVTYRNILSTVTDRTFDITKAKEQLGYQPKVSLEEGIKKTVQWYLEKGI